MEEYSVYETINQKDEGESKYWDVEDYEFSILGTEYTENRDGPYKFYTLVEKYSKEIAWIPDNDQQHINPQENVRLPDIREEDIGKIIQEIYAFKAKEKVILESILTTHKSFINRILNDYKAYYDWVKKQITPYDEVKKLTTSLISP